MLKGYHSFDKLELNESVPVPEPQGSEILVQSKYTSSQVSIRTLADVLSEGSIPQLPRCSYRSCKSVRT
jgi:hypothetical protein